MVKSSVLPLLQHPLLLRGSVRQRLTNVGGICPFGEPQGNGLLLRKSSILRVYPQPVVLDVQRNLIQKS